MAPLLTLHLSRAPLICSPASEHPLARPPHCSVVTNQIFKHKEFNFEKLGIGGLDRQFEQIFRRAFASRVFPPSVVERLGISHVKGVLLFGPPGGWGWGRARCGALHCAGVCRLPFAAAVGTWHLIGSSGGPGGAAMERKSLARALLGCESPEWQAAWRPRRPLVPAHLWKEGVSQECGRVRPRPAGTGKTLIARQIGKMLNGKEPKIVNGPEVLNKYVGASEENIRNLFKVRSGSSARGSRVAHCGAAGGRAGAWRGLRQARGQLYARSRPAARQRGGRAGRQRVGSMQRRTAAHLEWRLG